LIGFHKDLAGSRKDLEDSIGFLKGNILNPEDPEGKLSNP